MDKIITIKLTKAECMDLIDPVADAYNEILKNKLENTADFKSQFKALDKLHKQLWDAVYKK